MIHLKPGVQADKNWLIESLLHCRPDLTDLVTGTEDEIITRQEGGGCWETHQFNSDQFDNHLISLVKSEIF